MASNDGGPAFPLKRDPVERQIGAATLSADGFVGTRWDDRDQLGMSLRDYFAAQALVLGGEFFANAGCDGRPANIAAVAYEIADALLAERSK